MVTSARPNGHYRKIYRKIFENFEDIDVQFLLGSARENELSKTTKSIKREISDFDDLIIGDFTDNYENLVKKTMSGYIYLKGES